MKNLSDQYTRKLAKLNEQKDLKEIDFEKVGILSKKKNLDVPGDLSKDTGATGEDGEVKTDPWAGLGTIIFSVAVLKSIIGVAGTVVPAVIWWRLLKSKRELNGQISAYSFWKVMQDKRGLKSLGLNKRQMKEVWGKYKYELAVVTRKTILDAAEMVKNGEITALEGMRRCREYLPKGAKTTEMKAFQRLEADAVAAGKIAPKSEVDLLRRRWSSKTEPFNGAFIPQVKGSGFHREFTFPNISQKDWDALPPATQNALKQNVARNQFLAKDLTKDRAKELAMSKDELAAYKKAADKAAEKAALEAAKEKARAAGIIWP